MPSSEDQALKEIRLLRRKALIEEKLLSIFKLLPVEG